MDYLLLIIMMDYLLLIIIIGYFINILLTFIFTIKVYFDFSNFTEIYDHNFRRKLFIVKFRGFNNIKKALIYSLLFPFGSILYWLVFYRKYQNFNLSSGRTDMIDFLTHIIEKKD